ncbi:MAG: hypothetical protein ACQESR_03805 [Planctomycetota bacterium]
MLTLSLQLTSPGPLLPWLGPAMRGMVAMRLKHRVCRLAPPERGRQGAYCHGCRRQQGCPYGETFEPSPAAGRERFSGQNDVPPAVVLAPYYPVPVEARPGLQIPLRLTLLGQRAAEHAGAIQDALVECGRRDGLGQGNVRFTLVTERNSWSSGRIGAADLPPAPDAVLGRVPRLGVGLVAPLFLRRELNGGPSGGRRGDASRSRRVPIRRPEFSDLFRAALRTVGQLFRLYGHPLSADFAALKAAAEPVRLVEHCYEPFQQPKWTSRRRQRYLLQGCEGGGVYADVPLALVPWMLWGARLHVGGHRGAGAGGWRLILD